MLDIPADPDSRRQVRLFRAVKETELADLARAHRFRNPAGIEGKYFSTTLSGARDFARQAHEALGDGPYRVVSTSLPSILIKPLFRTIVDGGIETVFLPTKLSHRLAAPELEDE